MLQDERGVGEVVGATIVMLIVVASSTYFVWTEMRRGEAGVRGLAEMMRDAGHRQNQLLSLVYYKENRDTGTLRIYLFNYGSENAVIQRFWLGAQEVSPTSIRDAFTLRTVDAVSPKGLVEFTFPLPTENTFDFALLTIHRAVYSWRLTV